MQFYLGTDLLPAMGVLTSIAFESPHVSSATEPSPLRPASNITTYIWQNVSTKRRLEENNPLLNVQPHEYILTPGAPSKYWAKPHTYL